MEKAYFLTYKSKFTSILGKKNIDRIYVGDGECDFNFIYYLQKNFYIDEILSSGKKITLVTPCTFTQANIEIFKAYIIEKKEIYDFSGIEIVINDWGVLYLLDMLNIGANFVIGQYIYYQKRDSLSYDLVKKNNYSQNDLEILGNISINNQENQDYLSQYNFSGIEIFNYTLLRDLDYIKYPVHLQYPIIVKSITKYCYNNLISQNKGSLQIVQNCSGCEGKEGSYEFNNSGILGTYTGNKYTYKIFSQKILNSEKMKIQRIIYNFDF